MKYCGVRIYYICIIQVKVEAGKPIDVFINRVKYTYYTGVAHENSNDPKALWRVLNGKIHRKLHLTLLNGN